MESVIERIKKQKFFKFAGGIHPPEQKFLTVDKPIKTITLAKELILPVKQHIGKAGDILVQVGQKVLKGQALTKNDNPMCVPVHAPTSGTITAIKPSTMAHPSGMTDLCIFITPDGFDTWIKRDIVEDFKSLSKADIVDKIAAAGISGMGGAGFPTNIKVNTTPGIKFLIINAAECEPYITSDDLLMRERSAAIFNGLSILNHLLEPENILIGIEDNKPQAIKALKAATNDSKNIHVCVLPTKYPTGGEKQLIQALTGQEVPSGVLPVSLGVIVQNVATVFAISEAIIDDKPLIRRVVTVTGQALKKPQNLWVPLGTPISHLLEQCGFSQNSSEHDITQQRIIMGGPLMGFTLPSLDVPVVKTTNCILAPTVAEISPATKELECIRCGQCAEVCPSSLLPQELQWHAKAKEYDQLEKLNLFDCIDCGACAYVCPSQIPLVQYYRVAKAEIRQNKVQEAQAEKAKIRFEARNIRLEKEKLAREEKHKKAMAARKAATSPEQAKSNNSAVAAALARVKAKKAAQATATDVPVAEEADVKTRAAQAIARAKAKKTAAANAASAEQSVDKTDENIAPEQVSSAAAEKKARTAAAVARAKAKKAAAANAASAEQSVDKTDENIAPEQVSSAAAEKKARTAAAVAKAKAKKAAAANAASAEQSVDKTDENIAAEQVSSAAAEKKARTAAAVAKAKAKKAAAVKASSAEQSVDKTEESIASEQVSSAAAQKKARTAAAVAKAKAKKKIEREESKSAQEELDLVIDTKSVAKTSKQVEISPAELKKQKVAAAVAKAKAKKAATAANQETEAKKVSLSDTDKKAKIAAAISKAKTARAEKNKESE
ncbi:electron transport complex subunit RsxC [Thalassotalea psychrophila]|uniref:Ion-translocating oxidoreductase complex subunit C n=1 Tax=Thalassotalea psychrophila TaxID=3065647 RepID=A0ABY9TPG4_9GAMM|nr:electron transport complex subunit RsxC [Colwelliaceae bacterium SQ149]